MLTDCFSLFQWLVPLSNHRLDDVWDLFFRGGEHEENWNLKLVPYKILNTYLSKVCRVNTVNLCRIQRIHNILIPWGEIENSLNFRISHTWWLFGNTSVDQWYWFASIISGIYLVPAFEQLKVSSLLIKDVLIKNYFRCYIFKVIIWSTKTPCVA